jgi:hypothetical protein
MMPEPSPDELAKIICAHLADLENQLKDGVEVQKEINNLINTFVERRTSQLLATDQLLNAVFTVLNRAAPEGLPLDDAERNKVSELILTPLTTVQK